MENYEQLLIDLKTDLKNRVDRVETVENMLILFNNISAPLDVDVLETYFIWARIKTVEEVGDSYLDEPNRHYFTDTNTQYHANEVDKVRLLQISSNIFINKNLGLNLEDWMIEILDPPGEINDTN
jgi:hypothetical protein